MKTKHRKFSIPIYPATVHLYVTDDIGGVCRKIGYNCSVDDHMATSLYCGPVFTLIFTYKNLTHGLIGHEMFHTVNRIFEYIGDGDLTADKHEPRAYLFGHISKNVYKALNDWSLTIK